MEESPVEWLIIGKMLSMIRVGSMMYMQDALNELGINFSQFHVLFVLSRSSSMNQREISNMIGMNKSSITRAIQKLIDDGDIGRERDPSDKRAFNVFLTHQGREKIDGVLKILQEWSDHCLLGFEKEEISQFITYLKRIWNNIRDE